MAESTWILLIRHAQTDWNSAYRFQGHSDVPLNEEGRATIPPVIAELARWSPRRIYTSDLGRASEMAEAAGAELGVEVIPDQGLRECNYGSWEGLTLDEVRERYGEELERWQQDEAGMARGSGESLNEMRDRSWATLESLADRHTGHTIAAFTHSGPIRAAVCRLFDLSMGDRYRFQIDNASITALRKTSAGRWQLMLLNQTRHLNRPVDRSSPVATFPGK
jgi:broad specificity phosphatase PhoE